jgi:hypothetical protein
MKNAPPPTPRSLTLVLSLITTLALIVISAQPASAQTESVVYSFCPTGGWCPEGAVFKITP